MFFVFLLFCVEILCSVFVVFAYLCEIFSFPCFCVLLVGVVLIVAACTLLVCCALCVCGLFSVFCVCF